MELVPRDYSYEISNLEKLISTIQANVYFTITIIVAILTLAVGIAGWALSVLAKKWVNERVESELNRIDERIKLQIERNYQLTWRSGYIHGQYEPTLSDHGLNVSEAIVNDVGKEIIINKLKGFSQSRFVSLELIDSKGNALNKKITFIDEETIKVVTEVPVEPFTKWVLIWIKE